MQVSIETTSGLERRLTVGVPAERVDSEIHNRLQKAAANPNIRLKGFRPGKIPFKVFKQQFGSGVRSEVVGEIMSQTFYEAVSKENLKPAGQPSIEAMKNIDGQDLEYVATFEVFPEIELRNYSSLKLTKLVADVADADVSKMIENLRKQKAGWQVVERAAREGDRVTIDYTGTRDGEAFNGGSAKGSELVLGSKRMIPGFEDAIVGMKAGDTKDVALTFPADYHAEALKGAAVNFNIVVSAVSEQQLPAVDDAFMAEFGVREGGMEAFSKEIAANMARELKTAAKNKLKGQIMDGLIALHTEVQTPKVMIAQEIQTLRGNMLAQFGGASRAQDFAKLLPDDMFTDQAKRRVQLGLILNAYIAQEGIKADAEKVRAAIQEIASTYESPEEVVNYYYGNQRHLQEIQSLVIEDEVVERLLTVATVTEQASNYDEVMAPAASAQ